MLGRGNYSEVVQAALDTYFEQRRREAAKQ
jgi:hypothetical protein